MEGNLSAYRIFCQVAQYGNISYAAKELYISQPAVSKAISRLEESLGAKLFFRSSKGVSLTEEGRILYERACQAFGALEEGEEEVRRRKRFGVGQIHIGASHTLCKYLLMPYLKQFIEVNPHIMVSISCQSSYRTMELLKEGTIDVGLVGKTETWKDFEFYGIKWMEDIFVASPGYLKCLKAALGTEASAEVLLKNASLMLLEEENISRKYMEAYFVKNQMEAHQVLEAESMDLLIDFAKIGMGIACVVRQFVQEELRKGELVELVFPVSMERREAGFLYQPKRHKSLAEEKFLVLAGGLEEKREGSHENW